MSDTLTDAPAPIVSTCEPAAVDAAGAAALLGISRALFFKLDSQGRIGPQAVHLTDKLRRWCVAELRSWVRAGMPTRAEWSRLRSPLPEVHDA